MPAGATQPRRRCLGLAPVLALLSLASTQVWGKQRDDRSTDALGMDRLIAVAVQPSKNPTPLLRTHQAFVLPGGARTRIGARSLGQQQKQQQPALSRGGGMAATTGACVPLIHPHVCSTYQLTLTHVPTGTNEVSTDFEREKEALKVS